MLEPMKPDFESTYIPVKIGYFHTHTQAYCSYFLHLYFYEISYEL